MPPLYHFLRAPALCSGTPAGTAGEPKMLKTILITLCFVSSLLLLGCTKTETTAPNTNAGTTEKKATPPATTPAAGTTASTAGDKIGIPECDEFITAYENCVNKKVPAAMRAQFNSGLAQWRTSWKQLAVNPQSKPTLVSACKTQLESAKTSMKAYGCTF
jgi:hypothetical protein